MELKDLAIKPEDMRNQIVIFKHCYEISVEDAYRIAQRKLIEWLEDTHKISHIETWVFETCPYCGDRSGGDCETVTNHAHNGGYVHLPDKCWLCELKKQLREG